VLAYAHTLSIVPRPMLKSLRLALVSNMTTCRKKNCLLARSPDIRIVTSHGQSNCNTLPRCCHSIRCKYCCCISSDTACLAAATVFTALALQKLARVAELSGSPTEYKDAFSTECCAHTSHVASLKKSGKTPFHPQTFPLEKQHFELELNYCSAGGVKVFW
jgi:hypothetical protein